MYFLFLLFIPFLLYFERVLFVWSHATYICFHFLCMTSVACRAFFKLLWIFSEIPSISPGRLSRPTSSKVERFSDKLLYSLGLGRNNVRCIEIAVRHPPLSMKGPVCGVQRAVLVRHG